MAGRLACFFNSSYPFLTCLRHRMTCGIFHMLAGWILGKWFMDWGLSPIAPFLLRISAWLSRNSTLPEHFSELSCLANSSKSMMPFSARFFRLSVRWPGDFIASAITEKFPYCSLLHLQSKDTSIEFVLIFKVSSLLTSNRNYRVHPRPYRTMMWRQKAFMLKYSGWNFKFDAKMILYSFRWICKSCQGMVHINPSDNKTVDFFVVYDCGLGCFKCPRPTTQ